MIIDTTQTKIERDRYQYDCRCKECRELPPEITYEPTPVHGSHRSWTSWWVAPHLINVQSSKRPPNYNRYLQSHIMKQSQIGRDLDVEKVVLEIDWLAAGESDDKSN